MDNNGIFYVASPEIKVKLPLTALNAGVEIKEISFNSFLRGENRHRTCSVVLFQTNSLDEIECLMQAITVPGLMIDTRVVICSNDRKVLDAYRSDKFDIQDVINPDIFSMTFSNKIAEYLAAFRSLHSSHDIKEFYLDNKFYEIFEWFEESRWQWSELPDFSSIDRALISSQDIEILKEGAIIEFGTLPGAHNFLREWEDEFGFSTWALQWGGEESRHSLVQAKYLKEIGIDVRSKHAMFKREPYPMGENHSATLMINIISEYRAAHYYSQLANRAKEPVLRKIWRLLSKDEARHAKAFYIFCKDLCDSSEENVLEALKMAYIWLADRSDGIKHPAAHFYKHSSSEEGIKMIESNFEVVTDQADDNVFRVIQQITGNRSITDTRSLKTEIRQRA